jgi:hypothetical protein
MRSSLFLCIQFAVEGHDDYFIKKRDSVQRLGLSSPSKDNDKPLQKTTCVLQEACV